MPHTPRSLRRAIAASGARRTTHGPSLAVYSAESPGTPACGGNGNRACRLLAADIASEVLAWEVDHLGRGVDGGAIHSHHREDPAASRDEAIIGVASSTGMERQAV